MTNSVKERKCYRIYDKGTRSWFTVTAEEYADYTRENNTHRRRMQEYGRCCCPKGKRWLCDGNCSDCEFEVKPRSLNTPFSQDNGESVILLNILQCEREPVEEAVLEAYHLGQLIERLNSLLPEASEIGELRLKKVSDEKIAEQTGIKRTTANSRIKKAHQILKDEFEEFFPF